MAGIQERRLANGEVVYRVRVRRKGQGVFGSFGTRADAEAWRAAVLAALARGDDPPESPQARSQAIARPEALTVAEAAADLAEGMKAGTVRTKAGGLYKPSVVRKYEAALRLDVLPAIGAIPVPSLTRGDVQRLVDELAAERSVEHARKALVALRVSLRTAVRDELLAVDPCVGVVVLTRDTGEREVRVLTPAECEAIVAAAHADDVRLRRSLGGPLARLLFGTGLRLGEVLALPWGADGVDLRAGAVRVRRSLDRKRDQETGEFPFVAPKTRSSVRDVPLPPTDVARLRHHRMACGRPADGELLFADEFGEPLPPMGAPTHAWRRAVKAAKVADPRPRIHDARHAWAVAMLRAGVRPEAVAKLGGWSDVGMVYRLYGRHALPDELAGAGAALDAYRAEIGTGIDTGARAAQELPANS